MPASCQELDGKIDANGSRIKLRLEDGLPYYGGTSLRLEDSLPYYGGTSSVFGGDSSFQLMQSTPCLRSRPDDHAVPTLCRSSAASHSIDDDDDEAFSPSV